MDKQKTTGDPVLLTLRYRHSLPRIRHVEEAAPRADQRHNRIYHHHSWVGDFRMSPRLFGTLAENKQPDEEGHPLDIDPILPMWTASASLT